MALPLSDQQARTISPEARAFLQNSPYLDLPASALDEMARPDHVPAMRAQFQAGENVVEEKLIADNQLHLERTTLGGVPVVVITPPHIDPELRGAVAFNIHGGGFVMGTAAAAPVFTSLALSGLPALTRSADAAGASSRWTTAS